MWLYCSVVLLSHGEPSTPQPLLSTSTGHYCHLTHNTLYWRSRDPAKRQQEKLMGWAGQLAQSDQSSKVFTPWLWKKSARLHLHLCPLLLVGSSPLATWEHTSPCSRAQGDVRSSLQSAKKSCQEWEKGLLSQHRVSKGVLL